MSSKDSQENTESQEDPSHVTVLGAGYCARGRTTEDGLRLRVGFFMYLTWSRSAYNSLEDGRD